MATGGAANNNYPDIIRYYLQFPPVTRTLLTAIVLVSVSLQLKVISQYTLYSSFIGSALRFFDGGWGLWFLVTLFTLYQQSSQVEAFFSTPDYTWMLLMTATVVMTLSRLITPFGFYLPALQVAIAYRWSRLHPNSSVHVYVINVPAPYYPWVFLALDLVVSGPVQALVDFTGILGAHLHLFLTEEWPRQGGMRFDTPSWFKGLFLQSARGDRGWQNRAYGNVMPGRPASAGAEGSTAASSGVNRGSGNFRGAGHRLG